MPNRTQKRKPNKSRKAPKANGPPILSGTTSVMSRQAGVVFPTHLRRTLRYVDNAVITSTTGGQAYYQFRANSLFDPDFSGTGHQPRYFDQLCGSSGPYQTYRVLGCSVRLCITPSATRYWNIAAGFSDISSLSAGISGSGIALSYSELPGWIGWVLPLTGQSHTMTLKATMGQVHNVPESAIAIEDNYAAAYNANPVDTAYFNIVGNCVAASTDTLTIGVFMEFDVVFEDPYMVASS